MTSPIAMTPQETWWWFYMAGHVLGLVLVPVVLFSRRLSQSKIAWIMALLGFPWLGALLFWWFGSRRLERRVLGLRGVAAAALEPVVDAYRRTGVLPTRVGPSGISADLLVEARHLGASVPVPGNEFTLLAEGPEAMAAAEAAIRGARHHVHLTTYIFKRDPTGERMLRILEEVARRRVEVRVLYDGLGTLASLRHGEGFFDPLRRTGAKVEGFLPFGALRSGLRANLRNHRKLLIVDGDVAFTGGMNVGDEYATGRDWRDCHCRVAGPVVPSLQRVFASDWSFAAHEKLEDPAYYHRPPIVGDVPIQVIESGPDQEDPLAEDMMFGAIASARRSIDIVTPYFVPPEPIEHALRSAALRGRRVRILLGEHIDHQIVRWATDAYLPRMIEAGVEVWRHPKMVHGKVVIVDGTWATLGSTNLDARSLRLNFELNIA